MKKTIICKNCSKKFDFYGKKNRVCCSIKCLEKYRENIKKIDMSITPSFMYFCGFIWSDGHINKKNNSIVLSLSKDDGLNILKYIPKKFNHYFYKRYRYGVRCKDVMTYKLYNKHLKTFFISNGYLDKQQPSNFILDNKFTNYWFLGVVDGDGCWYHNKKNYTRSFSISSNIDQDWSYFENMLKSLNINYTLKKITTKLKHKKSLISVYGKKNILSLGNYLYNNGRYGLDRKYDKWLSMYENT